MLFNGSNQAEQFAVKATGQRVIFTRNLGNIVMDLKEVEQIDLDALGGTDTVTVNDVAGTDLQQFNIDLEGVKDGGAGDTAADTVIVNATNAAETLDISGATGSATITGLPAVVTIAHAEAPGDLLIVNSRGGDDHVSAANMKIDAIALSVDAGSGADTILGGDGNDTLTGGGGNDEIDGNKGNDVAFMGGGRDLFIWDPGDGSDGVEGQAGHDTMLFNGSGQAEIFDLSANGDRLRFFRNLGTIVMDVNEVEQVDLEALGGVDTVTVNDLSATDVRKVNIDLEGTKGSATGDGAADRIIINGTEDDDVALISGSAGAMLVTGLAAEVNITNAEGAFDQLAVNGLDGDDTIDASDLAAGVVSQFSADGGNGDDAVTGSDGDDTLLGGEGDDLLRGGPGTDAIDGGTGDNVIIPD